MKIRNAVFAKLGLFIFMGLSAQTQAQFGPGTTWNAFNDFYLSPGADGWTGATSPSALGTAWGYYIGNVNGGTGFPASIGSYLNSSQIYRYSSHDPLGVSGPVYSTRGAYSPAGLGAYYDNIGWGTSLGRYSTPWFEGAPGFSQGATNLIWMQANSIGNPNAEGIATVVSWKAPSAGVYEFAGQFLAANQSGNSAAVAIVDSVGGASLVSGGLVGRNVLSNNSTSAFSFMASYNAGDVVQFQVGPNYTTGNAVGLQVTATAIPEPSSGIMLTAGLGALGLINLRRRR